MRLFLRRRPRGLLRASRQELLDPSKSWWGGRRGRFADRRCCPVSVAPGVVPLVLPRRGSPSTHRSRGWLRSTRSFRTASAPTKLATRGIRTRAWMKQGYCVASACTSELHPVADQVPHAPSMTPVAMEHRHRLADVLGHVDEVDYHTVRSTAALARSSCVSAPWRGNVKTLRHAGRVRAFNHREWSPAEDARVAAVASPAAVRALAVELGRSLTGCFRRRGELRRRGHAVSRFRTGRPPDNRVTAFRRRRKASMMPRPEGRGNPPCFLKTGATA